MGRMDDVINVAGHRLSTGGMEEVIATHPDVAECAVIGVDDDLKGQVPVGLVVLKAGVTDDAADLKQELVQMIRDQIGPIACFKETSGRRAAAQDPLRQDPARHHAQDRRRRRSTACRPPSTTRPSSRRSRTR